MIGLALNFDFGEIKEISSIKFNLRSINKTNIINKYKLYAITDGGEIFIRDISISTDLKNNTISLGKTIKAKAVKLVALNDSTDLYNIASLEVKQINKELKEYSNISIINVGEEKDVSADLNELKLLEEGTVIARFNATDISSVHSILGISNSNTNNGYFCIYTMASRIGVEIRNQTEVGNTSNGTTNLAHIYGDATLNTGINTIAFKITKGVGYTLYLNGVLIKETKDGSTNFLKNIQGLDKLFIGKTKRYLANEYLFKGNIDFIRIYNKPLPNEYLIKETIVTKTPIVGENLPVGVYKSSLVDLFYPQYLGSNNYRIPALYTTKLGTILASIDARISSGVDSPNNIDTAIRRKELNKNWDEGKIILNFPASASAIDTTLLQDNDTGRIFLLATHYSHGYGYRNTKRGVGYEEINGVKYLNLYDASGNKYTVREQFKVYDSLGVITKYTLDIDKNLYDNGVKTDNVLTGTSPLKVYGTSFLLLLYSDDDGKNWSKPRDLNPDVKAPWMKFMGTGPGRGLQIKNGQYKGRLLLPIYYTNSSNFQSSAIIYSDDHGVTWKRGESPNDSRLGQVGNSDSVSTGSQLTESQVVEMPNGQLKLFMRNIGGASGYVRIATSFDGAQTWYDDVEQDTRLREPYCQLSVINYSIKVDGKDAIIFSNPDATSRSNGSIKIGLISEAGKYNNGQIKYSIDWKYNKVIKSDFFAYSCLTELQDGTIGIFYEGTGSQQMSYMSMNIDYIKYIAQTLVTIPQIEKLEIIKNKVYKSGENISFKIKFSETVSIIGNRQLDVSINNIISTFVMTKVNSGKEYIFTGTLPLNLSNGSYGLTIKSNSNVKFVGIFNKIFNISSDILLDNKVYIEGILENISIIPLENYENLSVLATGQEINKSIDINDIKTLTEGTIIIKFNSTDNSSVHSILGISNSKTNNGYFSLYIMASRIGVEIRNQTQIGNTSNGTTNLAHIYADVTLNSGVNTIAFKVTKGIGYSLYLNGILVNQTNDTNTKFLSDIVGLDTIFIGKTKRNLGNEYLFKGNIDYIKIYKEVLSNEYLLMKTGLTKKPNENEFLPNNIYKSGIIDVFKPGDLSSNNFRIPSLITTKKGTIIAGIDARKGGGQDSPNNIDAAIKISKDGGLTWDSGKILIDYPDKASTIDISLLQDSITERVFLLVDAFPNGYGAFQAKAGSGFKTINNTRYMILLNSNNTEFYLRPDGKVIDALGAITMYTIDGYNDLYKNSVKIGNIFGANSELKAFGTSYLILIYSDDEGITWSTPKFILSQFKKEWMTFLGTGPGRGIQLKNGTKAGRLIFPVYYLNGNSKQSTALIYSDDKGLTWNIGKSPNDGRVEGTITISSQTLNDATYELTESQVVEMPNGQLKIFMRNHAGYVRVATSFDYGESWDKTVELDKGLREPYCQLSIINYSRKFEGSDVVIFSNPDATSRRNGSIKIGFINQVGTYSNGEPKYSINWKYNKVIKSDYFAYSCLTETLDGKIGLFYEGTGNTIMSYTTMALDYISYNIQQAMAKIKFIVFDNMKYEVGDTISFKILFDQPVSIIGSRALDIMLNNILIKFNITEVNGVEYLFTSKIPLNILKGKYNITIKANNDMKIINIYNLSTSISTDILLSQIISIEENVIKNNNDNVGLIKFYENLENSNDNSQNYIIEYDSNIFTLDEGQKSNNGITTTTKKLNNEVVQQTVSKI